MEKEVLTNLLDDRFEKKANDLKPLLNYVAEQQQKLNDENITFVAAYDIYKEVFDKIAEKYYQYFSSKQFEKETTLIETKNKNWRKVKNFPEGRKEQAIFEMVGSVSRYLESIKNVVTRLISGHYNNLDQAYLNTGYNSPNSELSISPLDWIMRGGNRNASSWYKNIKKSSINIDKLLEKSIIKKDIAFDSNIINKITNWIKNNVEQIESVYLIRILNKLTEIKNYIINWNNIEKDFENYFQNLNILIVEILDYFNELNSTKKFDNNLINIIDKLEINSLIKNINKINNDINKLSNVENKQLNMEHIVNNTFDEIKRIYDYITENIVNTINKINSELKEKEKLYTQNDDIRTFSYEEIIFDSIENYEYENYGELLLKIDEILTNLNVSSKIKETWNNFIKILKDIENINKKIINTVDKTISDLKFNTNQYNISKSFKRDSNIYDIWLKTINEADSKYGDFYDILSDIDNIVETNDLKESLNFGGETLLTFINDALYKINNWENIINKSNISYGAFIRYVKNDLIWIIDACIKNPIKGIHNYVIKNNVVSSNVNNIFRLLTGSWANFNNEEDLQASRNINEYNKQKLHEFEEKLKQKKIKEFNSYVLSILGHEFSDNSILSIIIFIKSLSNKIDTFDNEDIKKLYNDLKESYKLYLYDKNIEQLKEKFYNVINFSKNIRTAQLDINKLNTEENIEYNKRKNLVDGIKEYFILDIQQYFYNLDEIDVYNYDEIFSYINKKYRYIINTFDLDKKYYGDEEKNLLINNFILYLKQEIEICEDKFVDKDNFEKSFILEKIIIPLCNNVLMKLSELSNNLQIKEAKNINNYRYGQFSGNISQVNRQRDVTKLPPQINQNQSNLLRKYETNIDKKNNDPTLKIENKENFSENLLNTFSNIYDIFLNNPTDNGFINGFFKGNSLEETLGTVFDYKTKVINFNNNLYPKFLVDYKGTLNNVKNQGINVDLTIIDRIYAVFLELRNIVKLFYQELSKKIEETENNIEILSNNMKDRTDKESEEYKNYESKVSELQENLQKLYNMKQDQVGNNGWSEEAKQILKRCSEMLNGNIYGLKQYITNEVKK